MLKFRVQERLSVYKHLREKYQIRTPSKIQNPKPWSPWLWGRSAGVTVIFRLEGFRLPLRIWQHLFYSIQWNHPSLQFFPKIVHAVLHICVVNVFLTAMWILPCRKMKEWDLNDLGKGAKINLPVIQQSVKGKTLPEAASCPPPVPSNSSYSREAPRRCVGDLCSKNPQTPQGEKESSHWPACLHFSRSYSSALHYLIFQPVSSTPKKMAVHQSMGWWLRHQRHLPTETIRLGSGGRNTFLIPILHMLLMIGR